jgi:hypothetical protein
MHEQILARGHPLHETGFPAAASPGGVEVERKEPGTGGHASMELNACPQGGVEKDPSVIGRSLWGKTRLLQEPDCPGPVVEYQQVHVPHGTMGDGLGQALGERGSLEGQTADVLRSEEILHPARGIELAHPYGELFLLGPAERHLGRVGPPGPLLVDCLMKKPGEALLAGHLDEQASPSFVWSRRELGRDEPPT